MNNLNNLNNNIYEFSTGINIDWVNGQWVSKGYTGDYLNVTRPEGIPNEIRRAIANKLFEGLEGNNPLQPAVIGRIIPGDPAWSVVAVISRGYDDRGRPLSAYRYFFCEGDRLDLIITWILKFPSIPVFDPTATQNIGQPHQATLSYQLKTLPQGVETHFSQLEIPYLMPGNNLSLEDTYIRAVAMAKVKNQPLSFAYNVEQLEAPWQFVLIYPNSPEAQQQIQVKLNNKPKILVSVDFDEKKVKSAIKNLTSQTKFPEAVQAIAEVIDSEQITVENWETWFNDQGAKKALTRPISSETMARLLTLRAILIPETLPELLDWLNLKVNEKLLASSLDFQQRFYHNYRELCLEKLNPLLDKLAQGIAHLLLRLLENNLDPEIVTELLTDPKSAWKGCRDNLLNQFGYDLEYISKHRKELATMLNSGINRNNQDQSLKDVFNCNPKLWIPIIKYWNNLSMGAYPLPNYLTFAQLFEQLNSHKNSYRIAAYFYQISQGKVDNQLFIKAFNKHDSVTYLGLTIRRDIPAAEIARRSASQGISNTGNFFRENAQWFFSLFIVLLIVSGVIFLPSLLKTLFPPKPEISEKLQNKAIKEENFQKTLTSLTELRDGIKNDYNIKDIQSNLIKNKLVTNVENQAIEKAIIDTLCQEDQCLLAKFIEEKPTEDQQIIWVKQIYQYELKQGDTRPNGIITSIDENNLNNQILLTLRKSLPVKILPIEQELALAQFSQSATEIKKIVDDLIKENYQKPEVIKTLKNQLKISDLVASSYSYGGVIDTVNTQPPEKLTEQQLKWIRKISEYQLSLENFTGQLGVMDQQTANQLKQAVKTQLSGNNTPAPTPTPTSTPTSTPSIKAEETTTMLPSPLPDYIPNAINKFDDSRKNLDAMVTKTCQEVEKYFSTGDESLGAKIRGHVSVDCNSKSEDSPIIKAIINQLSDNQPLIYKPDVSYTDEEKKAWVIAIHKYQQDAGVKLPDGHLGTGSVDKIQPKLKENVIKQLNQS
jgi:hypothetical protein